MSIKNRFGVLKKGTKVIGESFLLYFCIKYNYFI